ncbi:hypothetical protein [Caulobacter sp. NIBR2454]|uniref:hypothetical protein n=1 Tax=Caulobacter sp. NIBR2454 TaxID=3015996 RepID=UPI0022B67B74|nr:hypothetical protein [Caulobacter sp. NIBR2454]
MATVGQKLTKNAANRVSKSFPIAVTAVTNTDFVFDIPAGAIDVEFTTFTTTAFGAVTDAQITIGNVAGGAQYVAATTIKAVGRKAHALVDAAAAALLSFPGQAFVRVAQSGGNSATGAATLVVSYSLPTS